MRCHNILKDKSVNGTATQLDETYFLQVDLRLRSHTGVAN